MAFKGWPDAALAFYEGLEADNSKAYWLDHKEVYERDVKAPMDALLAELTAEFGETKLFRPYRDTRFSRDKSPYKTAIAATDRVGLRPALGRRALRRRRDVPHAAGPARPLPQGGRADTSGKNLEKVVATVTKSGLDVHAMEELKTAPKGYPKDHPRIELLAHEGPGRLAVVGARRVAPNRRRQEARASKRCAPPSRSSRGSTPTSAPPTETEASR